MTKVLLFVSFLMAHDFVACLEPQDRKFAKVVYVDDPRIHNGSTKELFAIVCDDVVLATQKQWKEVQLSLIETGEGHYRMKPLAEYSVMPML